jgi:hypothetical protein
MALNSGQYANARFYELLWPYRADVLHRARAICGNARDGEELAQETLLRAFAASDGLEKSDDVKGWLMQILQNARAERMAGSEAAPIEIAKSDEPAEFIDTSRLDAMIEMQIPRPHSSRVGRFLQIRAVRVAAIFIAVAGTIGLIYGSPSGRSVLASPELLAQFHEQLLGDNTNAVPVNSIDAANKALADVLHASMRIPQIPTIEVTKCDLQTIKDKPVACVLLQSGGVPVTMAVANAMDMRDPESERRIEKGTEYHITASGELNMVMTERHGRWICLISELPADGLVEIAKTIEL